MSEKTKCELCNIEVNSDFIKKHNNTKSHRRLLESDILINTIKNGTNKTKEEWIDTFKSIGINVPNYVIEYGNEEQEEVIITAEKKYYENNKEEIAKKNKVEVECKCGKKVKKNSMFKHLKSKKHLKFLEMQK